MKEKRTPWCSITGLAAVLFLACGNGTSPTSGGYVPATSPANHDSAGQGDDAAAPGGPAGQAPSGDGSATTGTSPIGASPPSRSSDAGVTGGGQDAAASGGTLPPVTSIDMDGPFAVTIEMNSGPNMGWVAHPTELGKDGLLHPIFTWGCGGGSQPSQYKDHLTRIASHGFVVEAHVSTGDGTDHKAAVDWLISENSRSGSEFYQKLNVKKIAAGGHSEGSISTYAFEATDKRLTTTIHVAGGSFDGNGYMSMHTPVALIDGDQDTLALSNTQTDYMKATVPAFLTVMTGVDHIYAAREGLPVIVAWLRWWLGDEIQRKTMFVGPNCDFCNGTYTTDPPESGGKFQSQSKNW